VLTGDPSKAGIELIKSLGITNIFTNCSPSDKQKQVEALTQQGAIVAMVGDGVNDSPVFNSAHLSIAMASGADISKNTADVVLLHSELYGIAHLFNTAQLTRTVIKQNLALSLCYNCSILPLAAMGLVPPWAAVIGMSTSSLLVIGNSLRLLKRG
jgi:Cu2+-exporting ATPase